MDSETKPTYKRFHRSDSLIYQYTVVDIDSLKNSDIPTLLRYCVKIVATPGVTWQSMANTVKEIRRNISPSNPPLFCCMVEHEEFYVALTYDGFIRMMEEGLQKYNLGYTYDEGIERLAKELTAARDFADWENTREPMDRSKKFMDFWPKD